MCIVVYKLVDMSDVEAIYGVIYKITCFVNGKIYIGQTTRSVEERFQEHMKADTHIGRAIRKYGVENFKVEVIAVCATKEELDAQEIRFIAEYDCMTPKGYNLTAGGDGVRSFSHTEETKAQISQTMTGTKQSDEHRANNLAAQHKRWLNPAEHEKASAAQRKRYEDPAEHAKTSEALKKSRAENPLSPESHAQQAESLRNFYKEHPEARQHLADLGKKQFETAESRQQHSDIMIQYYKEHQISEETRAKNSVAQKARQARLRLKRLPLLVAQQNRSAARWNTLPPAMEHFRVDQIGDIEKIFAEVKRLADQRRYAKQRAKRKLQSIAAENLSAAKLPAKIALS